VRQQICVVAVTWLVLAIIQGAFGLTVAFFIGCIACSFCIGAMWGAGSEINKRKERP